MAFGEDARKRCCFWKTVCFHEISVWSAPINQTVPTVPPSCSHCFLGRSVFGLWPETSSDAVPERTERLLRIKKATSHRSFQMMSSSEIKPLLTRLILKCRVQRRQRRWGVGVGYVIYSLHKGGVSLCMQLQTIARLI